jgi:simple sugar transport system permease protein
VTVEPLSAAPSVPSPAPEEAPPTPAPAWLDLLVAAGVRALTVLLALLAVVLAWGAIVVVSGGELGAAAVAVARAGLLRPDSLAAVASGAAPLLLAGLAAAIALRAGLVNLGVTGQALAGALAAAVVAQRVPGPAVLLVPLALLAGMGAGLAWALLPALLRVWRGVPELLTTVLASYLAVALVAALPAAAEPLAVRPAATIGDLAVPLARLAPGATWPALLTWTVPAALVVLLACAFMLRCTCAGLRFRVLAARSRAAQLSGARPGLTAIAALLLSGAVAGLAALQDVLGRGTPVGGGLGQTAPLALAHLPDYGLLALAVALAGRASGLGMIAAALALALLDRAGLAVGHVAGLPGGWVAIPQAVLVVAAVAAAGVARGLTARWESVQRRRPAAARQAAESAESADQASPAGKAEEATEGAHA